MLLEKLLPHLDIFQWIVASDIIYKNDALCIFKIGWNEATISLLSSRIPHLQSIYLSISGDISHIEIYSNSWLDQVLLTLWDYSYLLVVYRSIIELFPTPWSPKNTIRNLVQFLFVFEDILILLKIIVILSLTWLLSLLNHLN